MAAPRMVVRTAWFFLSPLGAEEGARGQAEPARVMPDPLGDFRDGPAHELQPRCGPTHLRPVDVDAYVSSHPGLALRGLDVLAQRLCEGDRRLSLTPCPRDIVRK